MLLGKQVAIQEFVLSEKEVQKIQFLFRPILVVSAILVIAVFLAGVFTNDARLMDVLILAMVIGAGALCVSFPLREHCGLQRLSWFKNGVEILSKEQGALRLHSSEIKRVSFACAYNYDVDDSMNIQALFRVYAHHYEITFETWTSKFWFSVPFLSIKGSEPVMNVPDFFEFMEQNALGQLFKKWGLVKVAKSEKSLPLGLIAFKKIEFSRP